MSSRAARFEWIIQINQFELNVIYGEKEREAATFQDEY